MRGGGGPPRLSAPARPRREAPLPPHRPTPPTPPPHPSSSRLTLPPGLTFSSPDRSPGLLFSSLLSFCFFAGISPADAAAAAGASPRSDIFPAPQPRHAAAKRGRGGRNACRKAAPAPRSPGGERRAATLLKKGSSRARRRAAPQRVGVGGRRRLRGQRGARSPRRGRA